MTNPNDPASPVLAKDHWDVLVTTKSGLTKLEHFAALAMQGFAADPSTLTGEPRNIAKAAVTWARALIAELNKQEAQP